MSGRLTVLQSFPAPRPTTNPYLVQLARSLPDDMDVTFFTWRAALLGRWDVLHLHWPENLLGARTPARRTARRALVLALVLRLAATGRPVVRTLHNLRPHEPPGRLDAVLLCALESRTVHRVRLNARTPVPAGAAATTVLHGHYLDVLVARPGLSPKPGRMLHFGLLRAYKGVEDLLAAFAGVSDLSGSLHVVGAVHPHAPVGLREALSVAAAADPRVHLTLRHVPDDELAAELAAARLVVLPYRDVHNTGAALLALSAGRPVLLPQVPVTEDLRDEVGPGWVRLYDGPLRADDLARALAADLPATPPDLSRRDWPEAGRVHREVYRSAIATRQRRSRQRRR